MAGLLLSSGKHYFWYQEIHCSTFIAGSKSHVLLIWLYGGCEWHCSVCWWEIHRD